MVENAETRYFVVDKDTGEKVTSKPLPLEEAKKVMENTLTESKSSGQQRNLGLKQYLLG